MIKVFNIFIFIFIDLWYTQSQTPKHKQTEKIQIHIPKHTKTNSDWLKASKTISYFFNRNVCYQSSQFVCSPNKNISLFSQKSLETNSLYHSSQEISNSFFFFLRKENFVSIFVFILINIFFFQQDNTFQSKYFS